MVAIKRSAGVTLEEIFKNYNHARQGSILALKLKADVTRSPKQ